MRELIIMQGVSGSGKSFTAAALHYYYTQHLGVQCYVFSTDEYWYTKNGDNPEKYDFEPKLLGKAHRWNQERVRIALEDGEDVVIVDNTNVHPKNAQVYIDMGRDHEYNVRTVSVDAEPHVINEANRDRPSDRTIPRDVIKRQRNSLKKIHLD